MDKVKLAKILEQAKREREMREQDQLKKAKVKRKRTLTEPQKLKIKNFIGKCEYCDNDPYEIHHINGNKGDNSYSNLIVLCSICHSDAGGKGIKGKYIPKDELRIIVRNRDKNTAKRIKEILYKKKNTRRKSDKNSAPQKLSMPKKIINYTKTDLGLPGGVL
jgi:hypothetical protein